MPAEGMNTGVQPEQSTEIGKDEAHSNRILRTFDAYEAQLHKILDQSQTELASINAITIQSLKDMALHSSVAAKSLIENMHHASKHYLTMLGQIDPKATDTIWNVDEQGYTAKQILDNDEFKAALEALIAKIIANVVNAKA